MGLFRPRKDTSGSMDLTEPPKEGSRSRFSFHRRSHEDSATRGTEPSLRLTKQTSPSRDETSDIKARGGALFKSQSDSHEPRSREDKKHRISNIRSEPVPPMPPLARSKSPPKAPASPPPSPNIVQDATHVMPTNGMNSKESEPTAKHHHKEGPMKTRAPSTRDSDGCASEPRSKTDQSKASTGPTPSPSLPPSPSPPAASSSTASQTSPCVKQTHHPPLKGNLIDGPPKGALKWPPTSSEAAAAKSTLQPTTPSMTPSLSQSSSIKGNTPKFAGDAESSSSGNKNEPINETLPKTNADLLSPSGSTGVGLRSALKSSGLRANAPKHASSPALPLAKTEEKSEATTTTSDVCVQTADIAGESSEEKATSSSSHIRRISFDENERPSPKANAKKATFASGVRTQALRSPSASDGGTPGLPIPAKPKSTVSIASEPVYDFSPSDASTLATPTEEGPSSGAPESPPLPKLFKSVVGFDDRRGNLGSPFACPGFDNEGSANELIKALTMRRMKTIKMEKSWAGVGAQDDESEEELSSARVKIIPRKGQV